MPLVAVVTLIGTALTIAALAIYLIRVAFLLRHVASRLAAVTVGLGEVVRKTEPVPPIVSMINDDLAEVDNKLRGMLERASAPAGAPQMRGGPVPVQSGSLAAAVAASGQQGGATTPPSSEPVAVGAGEPGRADLVWGIRSSPNVGSVPQKFAALAGLVYVAIGVIGFFVTGFNDLTEYTGERLFWFFPVTPFHNIVHIGVGGVWLLAAFLLTPIAAEGVNFAIAGVYVLAAILGYLGQLDFLGIGPGLVPDNFLHLITGVVALLFAGVLGRANAQPVGRPGHRVAA